MINFVHKNGHTGHQRTNQRWYYISKKHVLRSTIYVDSLMGLWKSTQFFDCAAVLKLFCSSTKYDSESTVRIIRIPVGSFGPSSYQLHIAVITSMALVFFIPNSLSSLPLVYLIKLISKSLVMLINVGLDVTPFVHIISLILLTPDICPITAATLT